MPTSNLVLFDTNVLLYAQDQTSLLYSKAQLAHQQVIDGTIGACVSLQNLMEFLSIITNSKRVRKPLVYSQAMIEIEKYLHQDIFHIIYPDQSSIKYLEKLVSYWRNTEPRHIYDIQLAATMLSNGVTRILTANTKDFTQFPGIKVVDLKSV